MELPIWKWLSENIGPIDQGWLDNRKSREYSDNWINGIGWTLGSEVGDASGSILAYKYYIDFDDNISDELIFQFSLTFG